MTRKRLVTAGEAVLLHLLGHLRYTPEDAVPIELTQAGISRAIGIRRSHVSQSLDAAIGKGAAEEHLSRVKGERRRRKCYFLTSDGKSAARDIRESVGSAVVKCRLPDGQNFDGPLTDLEEILGRDFSLPRLALLASGGEIEFPDTSREPYLPNHIPQTDMFVGRKPELDSLERLFDGREKILFLTGMPGVGKTWLAARAASEFGAGETFWYGITEWSSPRHASSHLADFLAATGFHRLEKYLETREVPDMADLQDILMSLPSRVILIFDDCQSAGASMVLFLKMLAAVSTSSKNLGLGFLGRQMPEFLGTHQLMNHGNVADIVLEPLDKESSMEMLRSRGIPEQDAARIAEKSGGYPLYLSLAGNHDGTAEPDDINQMLAREIWSTLPDAGNQMLYLLSVFREPVGPDALVERMEDIETLEALKKRCIVSDRGGWSMHGLLRDFYYSRQPPIERRLRHERAAEFYNMHSAGADASVEEIHHLFMALDHDSAVMALATQGNTLLGHGYVDEILGFLALVPEDWQNADELFRLGYLRAAALDLLGDWDGATEAYGKCLKLATDLEPDKEADVLRRLGAIQYRRGNFEEARLTFERALKIASMPCLIAELQGSLGVVMWKSGDVSGARKAHESDFAVSEKENDRRGMARALNNLGILDWQAGNSTAALERYARALKFAEKIPDKRLIAILYSNMGDAHRTMGKTEDAKRYYGRCLELAEDLKFNWQVAEAYRGLADLMPENRLDYLSRALAIFERLGAEDDARTVREMMT
ncbi:MAG: tetratricopeptide repeat protein [Candidatus Thermoplasmatota archaeon]|nr:tetratricopeptide repeat protein [Candidatus Thermoplasmatota archaeon]MBU4144454.1 tetratricopeptide repeat protein [Candidatus Thermoplasmatota archaeon]MBU4592314.1 tetratricopeptide repeat protein [Candidatus Thermoplasmatota archaeon]